MGTEAENENVEVELQGIHSSSDDNSYTSISPMAMHGRRQIFTNVRDITKKNVLDVLNDALSVHVKNRSEEMYLLKYERGIQPILERIKAYNSEINNKVVVNIANQVISFKASEFAGEPIQYVSRGSKKNIPEKLEKLNSMMLSEGKQSKDYSLAYKMFTAGVGYRLVLRDKAEQVAKGELFDEAPFEIYIPEPQNTFMIRLNDVTKRVVAGVTYVYLDKMKNRVQFTVYTANVTYFIEGTATHAEKVTETVVHNFGMVTLVEYPCNPVYMGAFEPALPLLDAYNTTMSNRLDGIEQFIQAIMVFEGVDISREQFLELKDLGAIKLPPTMDGRQSKVYYLNEQLDQSQTQTLVDDIYQTILQIVGMPSQGNANTSDSSNNGAMIVKNGWWNAEARALETEDMWKLAETEFLRIVLKICQEANVLDGLAVSDVEPKFGRRSYEDKLVKTQSFTTLIGSGVPPLQAYKYSGLDSDPEAAALQYEQFRAEQEAKEEAKVQEELDRERERIANERNARSVQASGSDNNESEQEDSDGAE